MYPQRRRGTRVDAWSGFKLTESCTVTPEPKQETLMGLLLLEARPLLQRFLVVVVSLLESLAYLRDAVRHKPVCSHDDAFQARAAASSA